MPPPPPVVSKYFYVLAILLGVAIGVSVVNMFVLPYILGKVTMQNKVENFDDSPPSPSDVVIYTVVTDPQHENLLKLQSSIVNKGLVDGDNFRVLVSGEPIGYKKGHGAKITLLYEALANLPDRSALVMLVDGYDVLFVASVKEIVSKYLELVEQKPDKTIIFCSEIYCWPDSHKAAHYDSVFPAGVETESPYRFLNSGFFMGPASDIMELIRPMLSDVKQATDDQRFYTERYLKGDSPIQLDTECNLTQCLASDMKDHIVWDDQQERWCNKETGAYPCIMHGNGDGKAFLFSTIEEKQGV
jgi:hypothetical protein